MTIPAGCKATLVFYLHIDTNETTASYAYDTFKVMAGSTTLGSFSNLNHASGYQGDANSRRFNKRVIGCHHVALTNCTDTRRQHRVPLFDAVPFALEQTSRAGEPAASLSQLALQNRCKTEPACSPSR